MCLDRNQVSNWQIEHRFNGRISSNAINSLNQNALLKTFTNQSNQLEMKKPKRHSHFNRQFVKLRDSLKFEKISRKYQFDSLLKKVKAKVFKTIYEATRRCLIDSFKLQRLPQNFITNIKIDFNKHYLNKTILEIYQEYGIITSIEDCFQNNLIKPDKKDIFEELVFLPFKEAYEFYITSRQYKKDQDKIKRKEGDKIEKLFSFIAYNFINYYSLSKGNKPKRPRLKTGLFKVMVENKSNVEIEQVQEKMDIILNQTRVLLKVFKN